MNIIKKLGAITLALTISFSALTGCSSADKTAVQETADNFLSIVKSGSTENIEDYASSEVANGNFIKTFDAEFLTSEFKNGFTSGEIDAQTSAKLDEFCNIFSNMVTGYDITKVNVDKNGVGTVVATINTSFPINIIGSDDAVNRITKAAEAYNIEHADEINKLYEEKTPEEVEDKIYNDMILIVIDTYEEIISESSEETYAIVLSLEKNAETDSWYVTNVQDYDSSVSGATAPATDTATTAESVTETANESSSEASTD